MWLTELDRKLKIQANNLQLVHQLITDFQKTIYDVSKMHHEEKKNAQPQKKKQFLLQIGNIFLYSWKPAFVLKGTANNLFKKNDLRQSVDCLFLMENCNLQLCPSSLF